MNICITRFGIHIGDRKYLNEYTAFGSVSLWLYSGQGQYSTSVKIWYHPSLLINYNTGHILIFQCDSSNLWSLTKNSGLHRTQQYISVCIWTRQESQRYDVVHGPLVLSCHVTGAQHDGRTEQGPVCLHMSTSLCGKSNTWVCSSTVSWLPDVQLQCQWVETFFSGSHLKCAVCGQWKGICQTVAVIPLSNQTVETGFAAVQQIRFMTWSCNKWADFLSDPVN